MKRYGYHRTSTREQHLDRGIAEITAYCEQNQLELERIFTDQQTGKNFNRPRYQVLKEDVLRSGDELIITEVDRLGRNKRDTLKVYKEWCKEYCNDQGRTVREFRANLSAHLGREYSDLVIRRNTGSCFKDYTLKEEVKQNYNRILDDRKKK